MKWLEIIELRSVRNGDALRELSLTELAGSAESEPELVEITLYRHGFIETDYSVHLVYESEKIPSPGSPFSLQLAATLAEYGLVSHSVWCRIIPGAEPE